MSQLILASKSAARQAMLRGAGLEFDCVTADIDEQAIKATLIQSGVGPERLASELALAKAVAVSKLYPDAYVIGGDQILWFDGACLSKSPDLGAAKALLSRLSGQRHQLYAGVQLVRGSQSLWHHVAHANLVMHNHDADTIERYIDRAGEVILSCVGCYQLEGLGAQLFEHIQGDYHTILGMPLIPLLNALKAQRISIL